MSVQGYHRISPEVGEFYGTVEVERDASGCYNEGDLYAAVEAAEALASQELVETTRQTTNLQRVTVTVSHVMELA